MNPQYWNRVEQLFSQAASLSTPERVAFLAQLSEPPEVQMKLEQLLRHHDQADSFLANPSWLGNSQPPPLLSPGEVVAGRFTIGRMLGRGGMGEVYLASEPLSKPVALKILRQSFDDDGRKRFLREFSLARRISHPNVCQVLELLVLDSGLPAFTMEYLEGESLATQLNGGGAFPEPQSLRIVRDILAGLAAAHAARVAHRDLKPENIFLLPIGDARRAVILDFGLARSEATAPVTALTAPDALLGTIDYMAPEQLRGERAGLAADVYAVALIAHQLRSGQKLFSGPSPAAVLLRLVEAPKLHPVFRGPWAAFLEACLQPDPRSRPTVAKAIDILEGRRSYLRRSTRRDLVRVAAGLVVAGAAEEAWRRGGAPAIPSGLVKVLVMPVRNSTGDPRLDGARQMLNDQILQSAKLDVLTPGNIATGLAYLERKGQSLTPELGRAVARRMGATLFVEPSLAGQSNAGLLWSLDLELLSQKPGSSMQTWRQDFSASSPNQLLEAIRRSANWMRKVAGEPAAEIAERSLPVAHATTANWDALLLYKRADEFKARGQYQQAEPLFKEALALDPDFVSCRILYADLLTNSYRAADAELVIRDALAIARKKGLSTRERYRIEARSGAWEERVQAYGAWAVHFPNDYYPLYLEAAERADRFETEAAIRLYEQALGREEYFGIHSELANEKMQMGRLAEVPAHAAALDRLKHPDQATILRGRLAYLEGDLSTAIARFGQARNAASTPWKYHALFLLMDAQTEAENLREATVLAEQGRQEQASLSNAAWEAQWCVAQAILELDQALSQKGLDLAGSHAAREHLARALRLSPHPISIALAGFARMPRELDRVTTGAAPNRILLRGALAMAHGAYANGYRDFLAAHDTGLQYTNIGRELLALAAEYAEPRAALPIWQRLATKPSIIWREVAHNWPGLIRLARVRRALLQAA